MKQTSSRFYAQGSWSGSLTALHDLHHAIELAAIAAHEQLESEWAKVEPVEGAAYRERNRDTDYAEQGWQNHCDYMSDEINSARNIRVEITDLRGQDSVEGSFADVERHFAANNIGSVHFTMQSAPQDLSEFRISVSLSRNGGVYFDVASSSPAWAGHYERAISETLSAQSVRYDKLVRGPIATVLVALPAPAILAFLLFGVHADYAVSIAAAVVALGWIQLAPRIAHVVGERVPKFETFAVGDQPKRARAIAILVPAVEIGLALLFGTLSLVAR